MRHSTMSNQKSYLGKILAANPNNPSDSLEKSLILVVTHTRSMVLGLQINRPLPEFTMSALGDQIGIFLDSDETVFYGGTQHPNKIHVVHSNDWAGITTIQINEEISVTNDISVLAAISRNEGPEYFKACAGFWAWENRRLEDQIQNKHCKDPHRWELIDASSELIFGSGIYDEHWHKVLEAVAREKVNAWF